jgi:hypothetical protein
MGVTELEASPLRISIGGPAFLAARQRQNIGPSDGLLAPAEGLGHRLPHGDDHRGENEIVGGCDQVFSELALGLRVAELDESRRCRAYDMRLPTSFDDFIDRFAGSQSKRANTRTWLEFLTDCRPEEIS